MWFSDDLGGVGVQGVYTQAHIQGDTETHTYRKHHSNKAKGLSF